MSVPYGEEDLLLTTRLIRHISAIQVRNLTPFPVRDAFTSALSHTHETTQLSSFSADDINTLTSRRRIRTLSNASGGLKLTIGASPEKERHSPTGGTVRGKNASGSKVSFTGYSDSATSTLRGSPGGRLTRPRTSSKASTSSIRTLASGSFQLPGTSSFLSDNTQVGLEAVIDSRLLETCLVITVTEVPPQEVATPLLANSSTPTALSPKSPSTPWSVDHRPAHHKSPQISQSPSLAALARHSRNASETSSPGRRPALSDKGAKTVREKGPSRPTIPPSISRAGSKQASLHIDPGHPLSEPITTRYISPVHRPSTNPEFAIGAALVSQFAELTRSNATSFHVSIWGKVSSDSRAPKAEASEEEPPYPNQHNTRWKKLDEWGVDMSELIAVAEDTAQNAGFSSNTLFLRLAPHNHLYRLPAKESSTLPLSASTLDYSSDPETSVRPKPSLKGREAPIRSKSSYRVPVKSAEGEEFTKTESWPDIFALASYQASIADNNATLDLLTRRLDQLIHADVLAPLKRDMSERQARITDVQIAQHKVLENCNQKLVELHERRATVERRREILSLAREMDRELANSHREQEEACNMERSKLAALHRNLSSTRAFLVSTVADIFPVELYSPPDLLFTILDLPLPIPLSAKDPAPPLSLPDHPQVNEDTIAGALGFIAEVLQLLSTYLGTSLAYPVTCVGSRSLIRDGISSMVGPRTFPLYSKGVDTYRFEYGVFLLNKNIELLMAEKDLRALDMRHTLPNLKNLLLILSHDATGMSEFRKRKPPETPSSSILELDPPPDSGSANAAEVISVALVETHTPPRSGATTPTPVNTDTSGNKSRSSFLGFAPFAGFLRGRYPSGQEAPADTSEDVEDGDDEDKRTIHGVTRDESGLGTDERGVVHGADVSLAESRAPGGIVVS